MRVVILGAGYAGLVTARKLDWRLGPRHPHDILLVDRWPYHQLIVRLHEVAAASIPPESAVVPIAHVLRGRRIRFHQAEVTGFDADSRCVRTGAGDLPYDLLVVALGSETEDHGLSGIREHGLPLKSLPDAMRLRRHVEGQVVRARRERDPERRRARLTFVLGGGGFTGGEMAGELADRVPELLALHEMPDPARIVVLEAGSDLLHGLPPALVRHATEVLARRGVEIRVHTPVAAAEPGRVVLASGETLAADTLIWVGGVRAVPVVARAGMAAGPGRRARVDAFLRWEGRENLFAIGDAAAVEDPTTGETVPPSAQLALQQAEHTSRNLHRLLAGLPLRPFQPTPVAEVVSLGRQHAVALVGGIALDGREARLLKSVSYWRYLQSVGAWPLPPVDPQGVWNTFCGNCQLTIVAL